MYIDKLLASYKIAYNSDCTTYYTLQLAIHNDKSKIIKKVGVRYLSRTNTSALFRNKRFALNLML